MNTRRKVLTSVAGAVVAGAVASRKAGATPPDGNGCYPVKLAWCRSFDHHVHAEISDDLKGWVDFSNNPFAFAIAVAGEVAGKKVYMKYASHDPRALDGAGKFEGVRLALNSYKG